MTSSNELNLQDESTAKSAKVYLVGAGPGDPRLLSLRAVELLGRCDVVLYDALVNPQVLNHVAAGAEQISVGKHGRGRVWNQTEIHEEILRQAALGRRIVRLKGGDTSIFARTGEEIEFLQSHGIEFEVVPGVTSASAASAYAGIPLTHRDWSSAVAFVTGHHQQTDGDDEADDDIDWSALAHFPGTLVMYMAVTNTRRWSRLLIEAGKAADTAVAVVRNASLPIQRTITTTLGQLADVVEGPPKLRPPIIFIVGPVVDLRSHMDWFTRLPLFSRSIMLGRPAGQNEILSSELAEIGANVLVEPALSIETPTSDSEEGRAVRASIENASQYDWIIFSSANGVRAWLDIFMQQRMDIRHLANCKLGGVGPSIQRSLAEYHLITELCLDENCNGETLANALEPSVRGKRVLVVSTNRARGILEEQLSKIASVDVVKAYITYPTAQLSDAVTNQLRSVQRLYVVASSTAIAQAQWNMLAGQSVETVWLSLSPRISEELRRLGATQVIEIADLQSNTIRAAILNDPN